MANIPPAGDPPPALPLIPIFSPRGAGGRVEGVILSESVVAINAHLVGYPPECRTLACLRQDHEELVLCQHCLNGWPRRWRGYLGFQSSRTGRIGLVELTPYAVQQVQVLRVKTACLRGKRIKLTRGPGKRNAPVFATIEEYMPRDHADLPPSPDVWGTLCKIMCAGGIQG